MNGYITKKELAERYRKSLSTISRWMSKGSSPFGKGTPLPSPEIRYNGGATLWKKSTITQWESRVLGFQIDES